MDGKAFVELVEKELKAQKISKAAFYKATGISSASFSQWRNEIYYPSPANIKNIEEFLGVSFHLSTKEKSPTPEGVELDKETIQLREIWDSADPEERKALLAMAEMLKARRNK